MQQLKLNPYPELPVVPDESKSANSGFDAPGSSSSSGCYESKNPSSSIGYQQASSSSHQFESSSVRISAPAAQNWSAASNNSADYGKFQPHQQQQSWASGDQQQQQNWASGDQQQQQAAQMAYHFMQIMEKSVNQIVNVPHFGMEWDTSDYDIMQNCKVMNTNTIWIRI